MWTNATIKLFDQLVLLLVLLFLHFLLLSGFNSMLLFYQLFPACLNMWVQDKELSSMSTFCDLNNSHPAFCLTIQELAKKDTLLTRCWCNDVYNRFSIIMTQPSTSFISCFFLDFCQYVSKSNHVHWMYVTYPKKTTAKGTYSRE